MVQKISPIDNEAVRWARQCLNMWIMPRYESFWIYCAFSIIFYASYKNLWRKICTERANVWVNFSKYLPDISISCWVLNCLNNLMMQFYSSQSHFSLMLELRSQLLGRWVHDKFKAWNWFMFHTFNVHSSRQTILPPTDRIEARWAERSLGAF